MTSAPADDKAAWLRSELARVRGAEPLAILGLGPDADAAAVRAAFLAATKRYHPQRFAREPAEVAALATEVFLVIRKAYDQLTGQGRFRAGASVSSPSIPATRATPPGRALTPTPGRVTTPAPGRTVTPAPGPPRVEALLEQARTRNARYEEGLAELAAGRTGAARALFERLATEDPHTTRYRARLYHARGLELRDAGDAEGAIRELERAHALEPESEDVRRALEALRTRKKAGLFARLFGR